jgi:hypothetical protein
MLVLVTTKRNSPYNLHYQAKVIENATKVVKTVIITGIISRIVFCLCITAIYLHLNLVV